MKWELKNNIILIGFMGSGKSTLGKRLAEVLKYEFVDTDIEIETKEGKSITCIFKEDGEEYFRNLETAVIREYLNREKGKVISVGGGLPLRQENREILKKLGMVIYLKTTPETVYERLKEDTSRPLLQTEDPRKRIEEMMEQREEKYRDASHIVLRTEGKQIEEILSEIPYAMTGEQKEMERKRIK